MCAEKQPQPETAPEQPTLIRSRTTRAARFSHCWLDQQLCLILRRASSRRRIWRRANAYRRAPRSAKEHYSRSKSPATIAFMLPNGPAPVRRNSCRLKPVVTQDLLPKESCGQYSQHHTHPHQTENHHRRLVAVCGATCLRLVSTSRRFPATQPGSISREAADLAKRKGFDYKKPISSLIRSPR
jgi:hypothetical protein